MNNDSIFNFISNKFFSRPVLIVLLLLMSSSPAKAQKITLADAVQSAVEKSEKIKQADERIAQKNASNTEAWGNFLPSVSLEATYNHMNDDLQFDLSPIRDVMLTLQSKNTVEFNNIYSLLGGKGPLSDPQKAAIYNGAYAQLNKAIPAFVDQLKRQDNQYLTASFVQPLFTGGKLYGAKKMATAELNAAGFDKMKVRNDIVRDVIDAYLNCELMKEVVGIRLQAVEDVHRHQSKAQKLFNEGMIPKYQLLRAEAAAVEAERNLLQDQNTLKLAILNLKEITGLESDIEIADSLTFFDALKTADDSKSLATANQPIFKLLDQKIESVNNGYIATRAAFLPTIAAFGKYEFLPDYLSALEPKWAVGVKLQYNLFNGFRDYAKLENIQHTGNELKFMKKDVEKKMFLLIDKAYLQAKSSVDEYKKALSNIDVVTENLRAIEKRYENGMATSLEVEDARLMLEKTETEKAKALTSYYKSLAELYAAEGTGEKFLEVWK